MAINPEVVVSEQRIGDGKALGSTSKSAVLGSTGGGAIGTVLAYLLIKSGFENDPTVAALIGGALATLVAPILAGISAKLTPSSGGVERTTRVQVTDSAKPAEDFVSDDGVPLDYTVAETPVNGYEEAAAGSTVRETGRHRAPAE